MDPFPEVSPLWDISHHIDINQLPDTDFLALLQKQFPTTDTYIPSFSDGINPQNISSYPLPSLTPPSEDSSPSPPGSTHDAPNDDSADSALKRKASDEDFSDGPSQKSQHTSQQQSDKKSGSAGPGGARRKASGSTSSNKDEGRLLKRKEQNRAAQRAFRERKEKHVKDLEDKVADLEAKNERALHENENLKDLLSRLQSENLALKQSAFTFSVPKNAASSSGPAPGVDSPRTAQNLFTTNSPQSVASSSTSAHISPKMTNPLDWSSLTTFDPAVLNLLDDSVAQPTATEGAMQMDFGFGANTGLASNSPYTTIASNPMFMSFASSFDSSSDSSSAPTPASVPSSFSATSSNSNNNNNAGASSSNVAFNFDINNLSSWPAPPAASQDTILDDLFSGYLTSTGSMDMSMLTQSPASISPVAHHAPKPRPSPPAMSSSSSSSSPASLFSNAASRPSPASDTSDKGLHNHDDPGCPKTKQELEQRIASEGASPFAPPPTSPANLRKASDSVLGTMISCAGSNFPKTAKSDQNIEVLSAWRSIRADPKFKDLDINELCSEFTSKARCDGTKVVLEPQGVHSILENLSKKQ